MALHHLFWEFRIESSQMSLRVRTWSPQADDVVHGLAVMPLLHHLRPMVDTITTLTIRATKRCKRYYHQLIVDELGAFTNVTDVHVDYPRLVELLERWRVSPGFLPSAGALTSTGWSTQRRVKLILTPRDSCPLSQPKEPMANGYTHLP
jgi:hypothetical protein